MRLHTTIRVCFALALGLGLALALLAVLNERQPEALAQVSRCFHVAPSCTGIPDCYPTVQRAVNAAYDGDVIKVAAGTYTDVHTAWVDQKPITQVVYVHRSVTIQGGYTTANWEDPDPVAHPAVLDARGQGRVLYAARGVSPTIDGLWITNGDAAGLGGGPSGEDVGGGVYFSQDVVTMTNSRVFSNTAGDYGGGLYLDESVAILSGNTIISNSAYQGGGLYLDRSDAALSSNTIAANSADYGGGLFLVSSAATLSGNAVVSNAATVRGGGLLLWRSDDAVLGGNGVIANIAGHGGGLYLDSSDSALRGNIVAANVATEGGGLYLSGSGATLANNVVADNRASAAGSGLYIVASYPLLLHNTIVRNGSAVLTAGGSAALTAGASGDGCGVYVTGEGTRLSDVDLINTILVGHKVGISVTARSVTATNRAVLEATLWGTGAWDNAADWGGAGTIVTGTRNYWGDPDFVAPSEGDYHIGVVSAALDRGVDAGLRDDMDGEPRPQGRGYDLGADETGLAVTKHAVPRLVEPGARVNYTIRVTNTSVVMLTTAITDILPDHVTPAGPLTWPPVTLTPGQVHVKTVVVTVEEDYAGVLTNVVEVTTDKGASGMYVETSMAGYRACLPLVLRKD
jgi:hypothetical protein